MLMSKQIRLVPKLCHLASAALLVALAMPAQSDTTFSPKPLFLSVNVPPNILLTMDDSGSMQRAFIPEICEGTGDNDFCTELHNNRYTKSAYFNPMYYDPTVTYPQPVDASGAAQTVTFDVAYRNGFDKVAATGNLPGTPPNPRNLEIQYRPTAYMTLYNNATTEDWM